MPKALCTCPVLNGLVVEAGQPDGVASQAQALLNQLS